MEPSLQYWRIVSASSETALELMEAKENYILAHLLFVFKEGRGNKMKFSAEEFHIVLIKKNRVLGGF